MNFAHPPRRTVREPILPMINVVFLLLIFFLMTARIEPSDPFDLVLPEVQTPEDVKGDMTLYVSLDGSVALAGMAGDAVWQALAERSAGQVLVIEADAEMPAKKLAQTIARLARIGIIQISIGVVPK